MNGEQREGTYDPTLEYVTYDEAVMLRQQQQQNAEAQEANTDAAAAE